eukprot:1188159-Prorocentrum_minimum.AAC.1
MTCWNIAGSKAIMHTLLEHNHVRCTTGRITVGECTNRGKVRGWISSVTLKMVRGSTHMVTGLGYGPNS